jgi:hypothetical protein
MLELRRVSKARGQGAQRTEAAVMHAQRTANEPTLSRAYSAGLERLLDGLICSGFLLLVA